MLFIPAVPILTILKTLLEQPGRGACHQNRRGTNSNHAMGKNVLLFEQVYNDLTTAVARAKQACRKRRKKSLKMVEAANHMSPTAHDKQHRGRPKGSKDTVPRKKRSNVRPPNVPSESSDSGSHSISVAYSGTDPIVRCGVAPYEAEACVPPETTIFDMHKASLSPLDTNQDPPCWELPIPC